MRRVRGTRAVVLLMVGMVLGLAMVGTPAGAHVTSSANHLWTHLKPKADKRYLPSNHNSLPRGKTVKGTWAVDGKNLSTADYAGSEISFGWRLPAAPAPHVIRSADTPPAECPGTYTDPKAKPGHLCLYESPIKSNAGDLVVYDFTGGGYGAASQFGATVVGRPAIDNAFFYMAGTWAATAGNATPSATAAARPHVCAPGLVPAC